MLQQWANTNPFRVNGWVQEPNGRESTAYLNIDFFPITHLPKNVFESGQVDSSLGRNASKRSRNLQDREWPADFGEQALLAKLAHL